MDVIIDDSRVRNHWTLHPLLSLETIAEVLAVNSDEMRGQTHLWRVQQVFPPGTWIDLPGCWTVRFVEVARVDTRTEQSRRDAELPGHRADEFVTVNGVERARPGPPDRPGPIIVTVAGMVMQESRDYTVSDGIVRFEDAPPQGACVDIQWGDGHRSITANGVARVFAGDQRHAALEQAEMPRSVVVQLTRDQIRRYFVHSPEDAGHGETISQLAVRLAWRDPSIDERYDRWRVGGVESDGDVWTVHFQAAPSGLLDVPSAPSALRTMPVRLPIGWTPDGSVPEAGLLTEIWHEAPFNNLHFLTRISEEFVAKFRGKFGHPESESSRLVHAILRGAAGCDVDILKQKFNPTDSVWLVEWVVKRPAAVSKLKSPGQRVERQAILADDVTEE